VAGIRNERDVERTLLLHLEEGTARLGFVVLFVAVLTPIITAYTKEFLLAWLQTTSPCAACLTVFEPGAWISIRWTAGLLMATMLATPLMAWNIRAFVRPALLPLEARRFTAGLMVFVAVVVGVSLTTAMFLAPWLYQSAVQSADAASLTQALDAASLARITLALMWILSLTSGALVLTLAAGMVGLLDEGNITSWRWKVNLPLTLILISTTWMTTTGIRWPMALVVLGVLEMGMLPFSKRPVRACPEVLDNDGARRRLMLVECSCDGALAFGDRKPPHPFVHHACANLCGSLKEREAVAERAKDLRLTDVIVAGCTTEPCPAGFGEALRSVGCNLRGLDLRQVEFVRTDSTSRSARQQRDLWIAGVLEPWSEEQMMLRVRAAMDEMPEATTFLHDPTTLRGGTYALPLHAPMSMVQTALEREGQ